MGNQRPVNFTTTTAMEGPLCFAACYTLFKNCLNLSMKYTVTTNTMPFPFICAQQKKREQMYEYMRDNRNAGLHLVGYNKNDDDTSSGKFLEL